MNLRKFIEQEPKEDFITVTVKIPASLKQIMDDQRKKDGVSIQRLLKGLIEAYLSESKKTRKS